MQRLAQNDQIDTLRIDRRILQIAQAKLQILQAVLLRLVRAEPDHLLRVVNGDHLLRAAGQQLTQQPLARTQIRHHQRRQNPEQQMTECLPRSSGAVTAIKSAGDLVKINLRLLVTAREDSFEVDLISAVFGHLFGPADRQLNEFLRHRIGISIQLVKCPLAIAPRLNQARLLQQAKMRRDA